MLQFFDIFIRSSIWLFVEKSIDMILILKVSLMLKTTNKAVGINVLGVLMKKDLQMLDLARPPKTNFTDLPNSQAGMVRHKDIGEAYKLGYQDGKKQSPQP